MTGANDNVEPIIAFSQREGIALSTITYNDDGVIRPIFYRLSQAEMVVPYAAPEHPHPRKFAFDMSACSAAPICLILTELHWSGQWRMWIGDSGERTYARVRLPRADSLLGPLLFECGVIVSDRMTVRGTCRSQWSGTYNRERDLHPRRRCRSPLEAY